MITSMLPIFDIPFIVIINFRATHSFISTVFMDEIENKCEKPNNLDVSTPSGEVINIIK